MAKIANRKSLVFSKRGQLLQVIPQLHMDRMLHERTPLVRLESRWTALRVYDDRFLHVFWGRHDRHRTPVIRITAITLTNASSITIARFRPSKVKICKPGRHGQKSNQLIWPKVLLRGRKRSLRKREQKARCTGATWGCTGASLVCTGASDFWETLGPSAPKTFCTPARQLSVICAKLTSVHGTLVCKSRCFLRRPT